MTLKCSKCNKELEFCNCDDIDERLKSARNDPNFIYKSCKRCDRHYARCKCVNPVWGTSWDGIGYEALDFIRKSMEMVSTINKNK